MQLKRIMPRANGGFSLIEAMIALVIIMVGLLGIAGLQALGVRNSAQAHIRTLAGADAKSLAAEIRSNSAYWTDPASVTRVTISWKSGVVNISPSSLASAPDCISISCSATQTAAYSLRQWARGLNDLPSNTSATIRRLAVAGTSASAYAVTMNWSENRMKGQGVTQAAGAATHSTTVVVKP